MEIIMKLKEHKTKRIHFFVDENGLLQGEYKSYHSDGSLYIHSYYKDDKRHGEYKQYNTDGSLECIEYYSNDKDVTDMYNKLKTWKSL